jgi:hypothetical protein
MIHPTKPDLIYCATCGGICPYQEWDKQEDWKTAHALVAGHTQIGARPPRYSKQPWMWMRCDCAAPPPVVAPPAAEVAPPTRRPAARPKRVHQQR